MLEITIAVYVIFCTAAILGGAYMRFAAPKDESMNYGLRTPQSRKSPEAWAYANRKLGMNWLRVGIVGLVAGVAAVFLIYNYKGETAAKALTVVCLVFLVVILSSSVTSVMTALYRKFDEDGRPVDPDDSEVKDEHYL